MSRMKRIRTAHIASASHLYYLPKAHLEIRSLIQQVSSIDPVIEDNSQGRERLRRHSGILQHSQLSGSTSHTMGHPVLKGHLQAHAVHYQTMAPLMMLARRYINTLPGFLDPPFWSSIHTVGSKDDNKPMSYASSRLTGHLKTLSEIWVHVHKTERS